MTYSITKRLVAVNLLDLAIPVWTCFKIYLKMVDLCYDVNYEYINEMLPKQL